MEGVIIPILLFGSRHLELVTGDKTTTIRRIWKKPLEVGDRLHCYWNLVSKERKKLFEAEITGVEVIKFKDLIKNDELAQEEGFENSSQLEVEYKKLYPDHHSPDSLFQIIRFKKLPLDDWEGQKIDEKAMITKRADILFDMGKFEDSVMCYTAALKHDPRDVYLLNRKGDNLSRLGRFQEAVKCYDQALEVDESNEYVWNNRAIALLNSNQPENALKSSDRAIQLNRKDPLILYWRGFILEMLRRLDESLKCYDKILEMDPQDPEAWSARGNVLSLMDRSEEAIESYDHALELHLDENLDATTWNRKGNALLELGRFKEAAECYKEALELEEYNDIYLSNLGVAYMELNQFEKAADSFKKALNLNQDNEDARILLDECLENL